MRTHCGQAGSKHRQKAVWKRRTYSCHREGGSLDREPLCFPVRARVGARLKSAGSAKCGGPFVLAKSLDKIADVWYKCW